MGRQNRQETTILYLSWYQEGVDFARSAVRQSLKREKEHSQKRFMRAQNAVTLLGMLFFPFLHSRKRVSEDDSLFSVP